MRKIVCACILVALLLTSCTTSQKVLETHENGQLILIPLTEETRQYREAVREKKDNEFLSEENYPALLSLIENRTGVQEFPEVELKSQLNVTKYGDDDVYTLENGDYDSILLFIHGGAYAFEIDKLHVQFCDKMVDKLNAKVYMPFYKLAPQATYKDAYELLDALYADLLSQNKPIYIMGDSAGGGLSLAFVEYLQRKGEKLPEKVILFSPWLDVSMASTEAMKEIEPRDISLSIYAPTQLAKLWAADLDLTDPLVSPMFGDLEKLPPVLVFVGTDEIMYPDSTIFYNKLKDMGKEVTLVYGEGLWHVFVISDIPESRECIDIITDFVL